STLPRAPRSTLLPYTTLFRSVRGADQREDVLVERRDGDVVLEAGVAVQHVGHVEEEGRAALGDDHHLQLARGLDDLLTRVAAGRSEEHTSELQSRENLVCRLL